MQRHIVQDSMDQLVIHATMHNQLGAARSCVEYWSKVYSLLKFLRFGRPKLCLGPVMFL